MRVLDLFSGLKGWSDPFKARGHEVVCVEIDPRFPADHRDVMDFDPAKWGHFDVVLASPPCTGFSVMQIGRNWTHDHQPKTETARRAVVLVERALEIIRQVNPRYFIIENPRAKLRKMPMMQSLERRTVTYCQYGEKRMKPTDLWGRFPPTLSLSLRRARTGLRVMSRPPEDRRPGRRAWIARRARRYRRHSPWRCA